MKKYGILWKFEYFSEPKLLINTICLLSVAFPLPLSTLSNDYYLNS